jgi:hypothetical protein
MSSALRRLSQQVPRLTRGLKTSGTAKKGTEKYSHEEIVYGDGHHGLRPGYHYVSPAALAQRSSRIESATWQALMA